MTSKHTTIFKSTLEGLFPIWKHTNKPKRECCHYHRPCHPSPHLHTEVSGHRASIWHQVHLQGRRALALAITPPPLKRINFPSAVPATALLGSPVGAGTWQGPLRPEGRSRAPAAKQRRGPPAPVRQGREWGMLLPEGVPAGAGGGRAGGPASLSLSL